MNDDPKWVRRRAAGSAELVGGTGPITAMCGVGDFLEIYKQDRTFHVRTPESVDPDQTNPDAPWVTAPVADIGSANLSIARVLLQSKAMLDAAMLAPGIDKAAVIRHLHSCKESLLACEATAKRLVSGIEQIVAQIESEGVSRDQHGRGLNPFPQVENFEFDCGTFLVHINRAIRLVCELPGHFITLKRRHSNFDHLGKELAETLGADVPLVSFLGLNTGIVAYLINLRNGHEHPNITRTVIRNFHVRPDGQISVPTWELAGQTVSTPAPIAQQVVEAVDFVRDMAESMVIHLIMQCRERAFPYVLEQIPEADIRPELPIRYRLTLDPRLFGADAD